MESRKVKYLIDTHIWVWWNAKPKSISPKIMDVLNKEKSGEFLLSAISVWELAKLVEKGRLRLSMDVGHWVDHALQLPGLRLVPIEPQIAVASTQLPQPFHDDPTDQIIVATARSENATILTSDKFITNYPHVRSVG